MAWVLQAISDGNDTRPEAALKACFRFPAGSFSLGRKGTDVVLLGDDSISRSHAQLTVPEGNSGKVQLTDTSRYGTTVNSVRLQEGVAATAKAGDVLRIGHHSLFKLQQVAESLYFLPQAQVSAAEHVPKLGFAVCETARGACTYVVAEPGEELTPGAACHLIAGRPAVTPDWLRAWVDRPTLQAPPPDAAAHPVRLARGMKRILDALVTGSLADMVVQPPAAPGPAPAPDGAAAGSARGVRAGASPRQARAAAGGKRKLPEGLQGGQGEPGMSEGTPRVGGRAPKAPAPHANGLGDAEGLHVDDGPDGVAELDGDDVSTVLDPGIIVREYSPGTALAEGGVGMPNFKAFRKQGAGGGPRMRPIAMEVYCEALVDGEAFLKAEAAKRQKLRTAEELFDAKLRARKAPAASRVVRR
ncbi:hypothetical protein WJX81_001090 [Elliptochloris bilobata]|uniref:FHA domain-containing protein n=1 Tax=Elliptochloris bilobata TaxID=381761 RepID=A0AAW1SJ49_9CHLO